MKIAVNTRLLIRNRLDGIGWFSFETLKRICANHPEHSFYFLFDRPYDKKFIFSENIVPVILPPPARHPVLWYIWLEFSVRRFLKRNNIDLYVSPDGFVPLHSKTPCYTVVHDINFYHRPEDLPLFSRLYYNYFFPRFVRKAGRVGTVSEYSARDIAGSYRIDRSGIDVFHNGVNTRYQPLPPEEIQKNREVLCNGFPYFVFIGTLHPRKNLANLLRAYNVFRKSSDSRVKMVIVGEKLFMTREMEKVLSSMDYSEDVVFTGRLEADKLHSVLASAMALTFVPYFEGFGIPVVEAMKCGVPVISSNVTSLPEVGEQSVVYCAPDNVEEIAERMKRISEDPAFREEYIRRGLKRAEHFSWDHTAKKLWEGIEKVLHES